MHAKRAPVILCIDVEPDKPFNHRANPMPWDGYLRAVEFMSQMRPALAAITGAPAHIAWFYRMDPQIEEIHGDPGWAITNHPELTRALLAASDELGLHTHPFRWDGTRDNWVQDFGNQRWVEHCLRMAFDTFRRELKRPCVSFRFGDRWMNNATFQLLETLGVQYDLTLEPGSKKLPSYHASIPYTGFIPDQRKVPRSIYRPSQRNYQSSDPARNDGPRVIPISTAPIHLASGDVYREPPLHRRLYDRLVHPERVRHWTHTLNIAEAPRVFRNILDFNLHTPGSRHLAMVARTHIFTSTEFSDNARANLDTLLDEYGARRDRSFAFMTPAEAVAHLAGTP